MHGRRIRGLPATIRLISEASRFPKSTHAGKGLGNRRQNAERSILDAREANESAQTSSHDGVGQRRWFGSDKEQLAESHFLLESESCPEIAERLGNKCT